MKKYLFIEQNDNQSKWQLIFIMKGIRIISPFRNYRKSTYEIMHKTEQQTRRFFKVKFRVYFIISALSNTSLWKGFFSSKYYFLCIENKSKSKQLILYFFIYLFFFTYPHVQLFFFKLYPVSTSTLMKNNDHILPTQSSWRACAFKNSKHLRHILIAKKTAELTNDIAICLFSWLVGHG